MLFLYESGEKRGNALYVKDLKRVGADFMPMATDMDYQYAPVEVDKGQIYLFTNYGAPRNRLMVAASGKLSLKGLLTMGHRAIGLWWLRLANCH